jgi:long-subunit fatty acid transport protein
MLDYIYRFVSHDRGLYLSVGIGYGNTSVSPDTNWQGGTISGSGWCFSAGVGYNFTKNLGLDVSAIATSTYHPESSGMGVRLYSWNQASLKYRFSMP